MRNQWVFHNEESIKNENWKQDKCHRVLETFDNCLKPSKSKEERWIRWQIWNYYSFFFSTLKKVMAESMATWKLEKKKSRLNIIFQGQGKHYCNHFMTKLLTYGSPSVCSSPSSASSFLLIGYQCTENISYDQHYLLGATKCIE